MQRTTWKLVGSVALMPLSLLALRIFKQDFVLLGFLAGLVLTILYVLDINRGVRLAEYSGKRPRVGTIVLSIAGLLFGLISVLLGLCLLAWIAYSVFLVRPSSYAGGNPLMGALVAGAFIFFGTKWIKRSFTREDSMGGGNEDSLDTADTPQHMFDKAERYFSSGRYSLCLDALLHLSETGHARASLLAAAILDKGGDGVESDPMRARALYLKSLAQAYSPGAALGLALMCYLGRGGSKDFSAARKYFGMIRGGAFPLIMLGVMSQKGYGCEANEQDALEYYDQAWALGHPVGLKNASIIRFRRHEYARAIAGFVRSAISIFWNYGLRKLPMLYSPKVVRNKAM